LGPAAVIRLPRSRDLWIIVAAGLAIRILLAYEFHGTHHVGIELLAAERVRGWDWVAVYGAAPPWTYPPLFLSWLVGASWLSDASGLSFHLLAKLGPILADVGLALAIYTYLGWREAGERARLVGAGLVMLGPSFIATSGYHGQIDSVAILFAVLALMAWEYAAQPGRAVRAGLLIGIGAAVKTVPLLLVPALIGSSRSWREAVKLLAAALVIPALVLVPLWLGGVDLHEVITYTGFPGLGGLSIVVDPALGWRWMTVLQPLAGGGTNGVGQALQDSSKVITLAALSAYLAFILRYRPAPVDAVALVWLVIYVFSPNFFLNYLVWGLPFFIMAGYLLEVGILQVVLVPATVAFYLSRWPTLSPVDAVLYVPLLIALWIFWVVATIALIQRIIRRREAREAGIQSPLLRPGSSGA
jgi:hypothetical protein